MITKCHKVARNALMLCAATVVAVLVSSCCAPASDAGRYQWVIIPGGESSSEQIRVIDTTTGEMAQWNGSTWSSSYTAPHSTPDWNAIRKQREAREKKEKEAREKREAFEKSFPQLPLEKQVALAQTISICKFRGKSPRITPPGLLRILPPGRDINLEHFETLKGDNISDLKVEPYKSTDDNLVVWFSGMVEGGYYLQFGLSHTPIDSKVVFLAPKTIIDDVKAEIKRQEEQKK